MLPGGEATRNRHETPDMQTEHIPLSGFFQTLCGHFIRRRWWWLALVLLLTVFFGSQMKKIRFDNSADIWFVEGHPSLAAKARFDATFGNDEFVYLLFTSDRTPFTPENFALMAELARTLEKLLEKSELPFHSYMRKGVEVVYFKDAQQVSDMLALMGAGSSVLEMENIRIRKQLRAAATRAANCDEHNSEKMLDAGQQQAEAIRRISLAEGLFTLPKALREMARLRVENPDLSLQELGEMADPPLSKSGVNHRLRRLMEIADRLEKEYGKGGEDG